MAEGIRNGWGVFPVRPAGVDGLGPDLGVRAEVAASQVGANGGEQLYQRRVVFVKERRELFAQTPRQCRARAAGGRGENDIALAHDGGQDEVAVLRVVGGVNPDAALTALGSNRGVCRGHALCEHLGPDLEMTEPETLQLGKIKRQRLDMIHRKRKAEV